MSLSVVKRPQGYKLSDTENTATITSSSGALFTKVTHGLSTGNFIYVKSQIGAHNGFWYVEVIDPDTFKIREYATKAVEAFIATGTAIYQLSTETLYWVCAHWPIVYKIQSNLWPVNGSDTARSVTTFTDYNGYTYLVLSGDVKATGTASALEEVVISGTASLDGVYKILNWFSDTNFVINLAYSAGNSFSGGTVQYYYFNYHAKIRVYAGLSASHPYTALKPYEIVAEQSAIPDSTGLIVFNVSEFVKKQLDIMKNDLLLSTLPNNIDAFCQFYISIAESYDDSDGYTVSEAVSAYSDDSQVFQAINAKMPFKSVNENVISPYLSTLRKWLTLFDSPTLTAGKYFDLGLISNNPSAGRIRRRIYKDDVLVDVQYDAVFSVSTSAGVYRIPISQSSWAEDRIDVTYVVTATDAAVSETITINVVTDCNEDSKYITWLNYLGHFDYWNFTAKHTHTINVEESTTQEKNIFTNYPKSIGEFADTIQQQTKRKSRKSIRIESQHVTREELDSIKWLFSSPLVQIVDSVYDRRTIIVDSSSVQLYQDKQDLFSIGFNASYTDELPAQSL